MIILQNLKFLVKSLGLQPFRLNNVKNNLNALCCLATVLLHIVMAVGYFILNIDDMEAIMSAALVPLGSVMLLTYILHFLFNSDRMTSLEKDLQDIVDERK